MAESSFAALKNELAIAPSSLPGRGPARPLPSTSECSTIVSLSTPDSATGLHWKSPTSTSNTPQAQHETVNVAVR